MKFLDRYSKKLQNTRKPVAILDLDGTLFDVNHRTVEIMKRFAASADVRERFAEEVAMVTGLDPKKMRYALEHTLNDLGIGRYSERSAHFISLAETFWRKHFFIDEYLAFDGVYPGAVEFTRKMYDDGAHIVYLSGRDIPNMSQGTLAALEKGGFPHSGNRVSLCLKPNYGMNDVLFKRQSLDMVRGIGDVIVTADNEPINVRMFMEEFPDALNIHFKTLYSQDLPLSGDSLLAVQEFHELGF